MKRAIWAFVVGAIGLGVASVQAGTESLSIVVKLTTDYTTSGFTGGNQGGEFMVTAVSGMGNLPQQPSPGYEGGKFETFCLEYSEEFYPNRNYHATIDTYAIGGGVAGQDSTVAGTRHDTLDPRTAYLYSQFWNGTLDGYNWADGSSRKGSATELQLAIWYIENELDTNVNGIKTQFLSSGQAKAWYDLAVDKTGVGKHIDGSDPAIGKATWGDTIGNVRVLNLWDSSTLAGPRDSTANLPYARQSQLVMVPLPAAAATTLAGLGMLLAGAAIRRIRNRAA